MTGVKTEYDQFIKGVCEQIGFNDLESPIQAYVAMIP